MDKDLMQRKLLLSSLLSCPGFVVLENEMKDYLTGNKVLLDNATSAPCESIGAMNFLVGRIKGQKDFFDVIEGFREELEQLADER